MWHHLVNEIYLYDNGIFYLPPLSITLTQRVYTLFYFFFIIINESFRKKRFPFFGSNETMKMAETLHLWLNKRRVKGWINTIFIWNMRNFSWHCMLSVLWRGYETCSIVFMSFVRWIESCLDLDLNTLSFKWEIQRGNCFEGFLYDKNGTVALF